MALPKVFVFKCGGWEVSVHSMSVCVCRAVKLFGRGVPYTQSLTVTLTSDSENVREIYIILT